MNNMFNVYKSFRNLDLWSPLPSYIMFTSVYFILLYYLAIPLLLVFVRMKICFTFSFKFMIDNNFSQCVKLLFYCHLLFPFVDIPAISLIFPLWMTCFSLFLLLKSYSVFETCCASWVWESIFSVFWTFRGIIFSNIFSNYLFLPHSSLVLLELQIDFYVIDFFTPYFITL